MRSGNSLSSQAILTLLDGGQQLIQKSFQFVIRAPFQAMTAILYLQTRFVGAAEASSANQLLPITNQDHFWQNNHELSLMPGMCTPLEEFSDRYYIMQNAPTFDSIEIFVITENHADLSHRRLKGHIVNSMAETGDIVFFEGWDSDTQKRCSAQCIDPQRSHISIGINGSESCEEKGFESLGIGDHLVCNGLNVPAESMPLFIQQATIQRREIMAFFPPIHRNLMEWVKKIKDEFNAHNRDDQKLIPLLEKMLETLLELINSPNYIKLLEDYLIPNNHRGTELSKKVKTIKKILSKKSSFTENELIKIANIAQAIDEEGNVCIQHTVNIYKMLEKELSDPKNEQYLVVERSRHAMNVVESEKYSFLRKFMFIGEGHVITNKNRNESERVFNYEDDDIQSEFRNRLNNHYHAILVKK